MLNENKLKQVMAVVLKVEASSINEESSMDNINTWDSLGHMNLILALEDEFKILIPDEDAGNISSYKLIKFVLGELLDGVA
jgi:acyl carrier protein